MRSRASHSVANMLLSCLNTPSYVLHRHFTGTAWHGMACHQPLLRNLRGLLRVRITPAPDREECLELERVLRAGVESCSFKGWLRRIWIRR